MDEETVASLVRRVGVALVVLSLGRGLGPAFAAAVVAIGGVVLGRARVMSLLGRTDLRRWAAAVAVSVTMSGLWLAHIGRAYPLPDRPGSGWARALEWVPWYLHQMVGVFGTNDSAVQVLGDETLKTIARELVDIVRRNVSIDWTVKESVRAKLRVIVKRILRKHGYPPDKQEAATDTVLAQAEELSDVWMATA